MELNYYRCRLEESKITIRLYRLFKMEAFYTDVVCTFLTIIPDSIHINLSNKQEMSSAFQFLDNLFLHVL
jgi:hypothetical protein